MLRLDCTRPSLRVTDGVDAERDLELLVCFFSLGNSSCREFC